VQTCALPISGYGIAFDADGSDVISRLGLPHGPLPASDVLEVANLTSARPGTSFRIAVDGGVARTITLEADDTYGFLAYKINAVLGTKGRASINNESDGQRLVIEAFNGGRIRLLSGSDGLDALASLGLRPTELFG